MHRDTSDQPMPVEPPSVADVRMHGFSRRSEVPAVLEWIDRHASRLPDELVPLEESCGPNPGRGPRVAGRRSGIRSGRHGWLRAARFGDRRGKRLQPPRLSGARPGDAGAPLRRRRPRQRRHPHHDGRPDARRARCRAAGGIRHGGRRTDRDRAARRAGSAPRSPRRGHRGRRAGAGCGTAATSAGHRPDRIVGPRRDFRRSTAARSHSGHGQRGQSARTTERAVSDLRCEFLHAARPHRPRWRHRGRPLPAR